MLDMLIIGGLNYNTLSIVEALGQKGVRSDVIVMDWRKNNFITKSKYVNRCFSCSKLDFLLNCITSNFSKKPKKTACIIEGDILAEYINNHYDSLCDILVIPGINTEGQLGQWMNKHHMTVEATKYGIDIPQSWLVNIKDELPKQILYPCVTKSVTSASGGKVESKEFDCRKDLISFMRSPHLCDYLQIQQKIEHTFEFQYLGVSLNGGDYIFIPGRTYIEEVHNFKNGTFLRYENEIGNPNTLGNIKRYIKGIGYSGLFSAEFIHGLDGKDYFLELNFRNDGNCNACTSAGANLPYIWYLYCCGGNYQKEIENTRISSVYYCPEFIDLELVINGQITLWEWIRRIRKASCYSIYYKKDKGPFFHGLFYELGRPLVKKIVKKILNR